MKIILITQGISPIVKPIFNTHHTIVGVIESAPRNKSSPTKNIFLDTYNLIFSLMGRPKQLRSYSKKEDVPYFYFNKSNSDECQKFIQQLDPDLIVVYSMSQLLPEKLFSIPKYGTINLHPSLLPKYRGPNPYLWMYYNMEKEGGVTVHYVDIGEDTGDIILQDYYDIPLGIKLPDLTNIAIIQKGVPLMLKSIELLENEDVHPVSQPTQSPTVRARNINQNETDGIIDWEKDDVQKIWHLLRGYSDRMDLIEQPKGIFVGQKWEILSYSLEKHQKIPSKNVDKINNMPCLFCKNGVIYLKVEFKIRRLLFHMFKLFR